VYLFCITCNNDEDVCSRRKKKTSTLHRTVSRTGIIQGKKHLRGFVPARNGDILSSRDLVLLGSPSRNFGPCKRSAYIKDQMSCYLDAINFEYLPENSHAAVTNLDVARLDYRNFRCLYTEIKGKKLKSQLKDFLVSLTHRHTAFS